MHAFGKGLFLHLCETELRLRVAETHTLDAATRQEAVGWHCFRGLCTAQTLFYFEPDASLTLTNNALRPVLLPSANLVTVLCDDEESFPVHRRLLRPCLALTRAIRSPGPDCGCEVEVALSSSVFDKVLLFLEKLDAGSSSMPAFSLSHVDELAEAARTLGLRSLDDWCSSQRCGFTARLREYSFAEVRAANAAGGWLLLIDGMVLDVKAWLPEHPGGASIMKSLDMDASRYFELYHHSRESFLYLRHFYIGELAAEDRPVVPQAERPSADFLAALTTFCAPFRVAVKTARSF